MLSPAGRRKQQWQARTQEREAGASCLEFRTQTALSTEQAANEPGSENKLGLPIQSLLGGEGRFLLSPPVCFSVSHPRPRWWGRAIWGQRHLAHGGLKPLQCVVRKERRLLQAYVLRKEQKGLRTDQFRPRRKQGKGGPRDLWLS